MRTIGPLAEIHVFDELPPDLLTAAHALALSTNEVFAAHDGPDPGVLQLSRSSHTGLFDELSDTRPGFMAMETDVPGRYNVIAQLPSMTGERMNKLYAAAYTLQRHEGTASLGLRPGNIAVISLARTIERQLTPPEPLSEQERNPVHVINSLARALGDLVREKTPYMYGYHWSATETVGSNHTVKIPSWVQF